MNRYNISRVARRQCSWCHRQLIPRSLSTAKTSSPPFHAMAHPWLTMGHALNAYGHTAVNHESCHGRSWTHHGHAMGHAMAAHGIAAVNHGSCRGRTIVMPWSLMAAPWSTMGAVMVIPRCIHVQPWVTLWCIQIKPWCSQGHHVMAAHGDIMVNHGSCHGHHAMNAHRDIMVNHGPCHGAAMAIMPWPLMETSWSTMGHAMSADRHTMVQP